MGEPSSSGQSPTPRPSRQGRGKGLRMTEEAGKGSLSDSEENSPEAIPDEVEFPVEDVLDLHTFRPAEAGDLIQDYLTAAWEKDYREVRIIHGKGTGVLRERVHSVLRKHALVVSFRQADAEAGGWGATVVMLRGRDCEHP